MSKISELSNGGALLSTDDLIVVRSGGNVRAQLSSLNGIAIGGSTPAAGSFTTGSFSGNVSFADNAKAIFGTGNDLEVYHDGNNSRVEDKGTGGLRLIGSNFVSLQSSSGENKIVATSNGAVQLFYNNAEKLATTSTGIDVTGVITTDGMTTSADVNFGDNDKAIFGASSDLQIYHDASHSYIVDAGTGNMYLSTNGNGIVMQASLSETMFAALPNGAVSLYHNNAPKLATTSTGIDVTGTVTTSDNVGIGVVPETYHSSYDALQVGNTALIGRSGSTSETYLTANAYYDGTWKYIKTDEASVVAQSGGIISFLNAASGSADSSISWDESMRISGGNVGIGTSDIHADLHLGAASPHIDIGPSTGNRGKVGFDSNNVYIGSTSGTGEIHFKNNIGSTDAPHSSGDTKMIITDSGVLVGRDAVGTTGTGHSIRGNDSAIFARDSGEVLIIARNTNGGEAVRFDCAGTNGVGSIGVTTSATTYNTSSDQRLKENIADADDAGSKIDAIQVRQFDWKADGSHQDYGMVAQELRTVAPEAVSTPEDPDRMMGVDYSKLVPMLIKELQTLRSRVAELEK